MSDNRFSSPAEQELPGLVAQGRTINETLEIARDVAKKLIEAQDERHTAVSLTKAGESFDYPLVVSGGWDGLLDSNTVRS